MIRLVTDKDLKQLFHWRNLSEAIELSALKRTVSWKEHTQWFANLDKNKTIIFIIQPNAGMVRCDLDDKDVVISIYLKPEHRGKGTAVVAVNNAMREVLNKWEAHRFLAYIRADNEPSLKLFSKLGFIKTATKNGLVQMESL